MTTEMPRRRPRPIAPRLRTSRVISARAGPVEHREINVSQVRRFSPWVLGMLAAAPLASAFGQNLDAGKPASQIFAEVCANCHRSPRQLRSNAGASFLREHYTTGSGMASNMAAYLSSAGSAARAAGARQPKRPPNPVAAPAPAATTTARDTPATDISRDPPRRVQQARPGSTRAEATAEAEPPASSQAPTPPVPARPALEEFEE
jgi:hypothetical protein